MNDPRQPARRSTLTALPSNARATSTSASGTSNTLQQPQPPSRNVSDENIISQSHSPSSINPSFTGSSQGEPELGRGSFTPSNAYFGEPGEQSIYNFTPGGPLVWDWNNPTEFGAFGTYYEPQGELSQELQTQTPPTNEFTNPFPVKAPISEERGQNLGMNATLPSHTFAAPAAQRRESADPMNTRAGMKRKVDSDGNALQTAQDPSLTKRPSISKASSSQSQGSRQTRSKAQDRGGKEASQDADASGSTQGAEDVDQTQSSAQKQREKEASSNERRIAEISSKLTTVLPAGKVFPIQIGSELFRLSGASISSDAPSYFSHYFGEQLLQTGGRASQVKTLYIDRDPMTFRDIALHLQGYFVKPKDEEHFVRLFADAQFYSLPRLTQQLFKSEIFIQVGDRHFQIPRDIFSSPGDSPNFFSLGFAHFFSTPSEVFPGLDRQTLLRPPSILPPSIPNRSGDVFADLLRILQGYNVHIRDASHRAELLRDARYFHLKGVEQKLIPCSINYNLLRGRSEILLRLDDIRQSGVSFTPDPSSSSTTSKTNTPADLSSSAATNSSAPTGWVTYQRPYIDENAADLILEISSTEATTLHLSTMRATFEGTTKARIASLFAVVANKMNLPAMMPLGLMMLQSGGGIARQPASPANSGVSGEKVRITIDKDAFVEVDGDVIDWASESDIQPDSDDEEEEEEEEEISPVQKPILGLPKIKKWKEGRVVDREMEWIVRKGQWRLRVGRGEDRVEVSLVAVRIEAFTEERERNGRRGFLA